VYELATVGTGGVKHDAEDWRRRQQEWTAGFVLTL